MRIKLLLIIVVSIAVVFCYTNIAKTQEVGLSVPFGENVLNVHSVCYSGKIKAVHLYDDTKSSEYADMLNLGINTFIISGSLNNNVDYSNNVDNLSSNLKRFAELAKQNNVIFFPVLKFRHFVSDSIVTKNNVVYSDGVNGDHVSLWDKTYWDHLTKTVKLLASLSLKYPDQYKVDGVFFDFELYDNKSGNYFDDTWGFEDEIFNKYLIEKKLNNIASVPKASNKKNQRYNWLKSKGYLPNYYKFLRLEIENLAEKMKKEVKKVNSAFLIGAYPSPTEERRYLASIYDGWSESNSPTIIWGTETYYKGGSSSIPAKLKNDKRPQGHYNVSSVYGNNGENIYAYYVGGLTNEGYKDVNNSAYNLYNVAKNSNGYWIFTASSYFNSTEKIRGNYDYSVPKIKCYDQETNYLFECRTFSNNSDFNNLRSYYFEQITTANSEINKLVSNKNYVTPLGIKTKPDEDINLKIKSFSIPDSVKRGENFQIECDFGTALPCIGADHAGERCTFVAFNGTKAVFDCKARVEGLQKNYCYFKSNNTMQDDPKCNNEWHQIDSIEVLPGLPCTPNWVCGEWKDCIGGYQHKNCFDSNDCGVQTDKPNIWQSCQETIPRSIIVYSPNSVGISWIKGSKQTIRWSTKNLPWESLIRIGFINSNTGIEYFLGEKDNDVEQFYFTVPPDLPIGKYKVKLETTYEGQTYSDISDNDFDIVGTTSSQNISQDTLASIYSLITKLIEQMSALLRK